MIDVLRRCLPVFLLMASVAGLAQNWTQPTPEELKMTADPEAPGAEVVCLAMYVEDDYNKTLTHAVYVRLKILNEKGRDYADVEIPYEDDYKIKSVEARTIHSDGTVIPFSGKPYDKLIEKSKHLKEKAKVFTLPDVQVGSILEYRIVLSLGSLWYGYPKWYVQKRFFIRKAHYEFAPNQLDASDLTKYASMLPKGTAVQYDGKRQVYTLDVEKVAPLVEEDYMPPLDSLSYRVLFYFTKFNSADEYWKAAGDAWSKEIDEFMKSGKLSGIAAQIVTASDSPDQKAQKIYDAVMKLENTSLTREQSKAENKAHKVKIRTAEDVWNAKRGDSAEIAVLYVALARAAGLKAYAAMVTDRSRALFIPNFLTMDQLDDYIAIVELDGKEKFLDPGERYCPFGELQWKHAGTRGLRQTEHGSAVGPTPPPGYKSTSIFRNADLTIDTAGQVEGSLHIGMTGNQALAWRQKALSSDEQEVRKEFEDSLKGELPQGIEVKINHILGLTDYRSALMVVVDVSGPLGTKTGKRIFIPATFFEASNKALFVEGKRTNPVDLEFPYAEQDDVVIRLPKSLVIESAPKNAEMTMPQNVLYRTSFKEDQGQLRVSRLFLLANSLYSVDEYGALKDLIQKVNAKDQEQAILQFAPAESGGISSNSVH